MAYPHPAQEVKRLYNDGIISARECAEELEDTLLHKYFSNNQQKDKALFNQVVRLFGKLEKRHISLEQYCNHLSELSGLKN